MTEFYPGALVFLRPGGGIMTDMSDDASMIITFRMMTKPVIVIGVTNRVIEDQFGFTPLHIVFIPGEGMFSVAGSNLMSSDEMLDAVYVKYPR